MESADYNRFSRLARRYARLLGLSHDDAEDCAQAFLVRFLKLPTEQQQIICEKPVISVYRFVLNFKRSLDRRHKCESKARDSSNSVICRYDPDCQLLRQEIRQRIEEALNRLSETHRKIFFARVHEELTYAQLAKQFGGTAESIRKTFQRIQNKLRADLRMAGLTDEDIRDYLYYLNQSAGGGTVGTNNIFCLLCS